MALERDFGSDWAGLGAIRQLAARAAASAKVLQQHSPTHGHALHYIQATSTTFRCSKCAAMWCQPRHVCRVDKEENEMAAASGTANCSINAEFVRVFLLKMKKLWRIAPEMMICIEKWPFILQFEVLSQCGLAVTICARAAGKALQTRAQ